MFCQRDVTMPPGSKEVPKIPSSGGMKQITLSSELPTVTSPNCSVSSTSSLPKQQRGAGNGSCGQSVILHLRCSFVVTLLLLHCGIPPTGCYPSQTDPMWASHRQQLFMNCSHMGPYYRIRPSRANCSNMGPPQVAAPPRHSAPPSAPLHGLQLRPGDCSCGGSPWAAASSRPHPPAPAGAPPWAAAWRSAPWGAHGLQGDSLLHQEPLHRLQGNCSGAWSTSCPAPALMLWAGGLFLTHHSPR
ncbi:uncharacterized protein [Anas platyrhynchos]|uniref:uncharacterized protein isoform X2 n=1 Tax=Anas platyrhynchos TaxID=8839 RepID=UPI003AF310BD